MKRILHTPKAILRSDIQLRSSQPRSPNRHADILLILVICPQESNEISAISDKSEAGKVVKHTLRGVYMGKTGLYGLLYVVVDVFALVDAARAESDGRNLECVCSVPSG